MKWVLLSCGHACWVSWLEAFPGREVMCPEYRSEANVNGWKCANTPQRVVEVIPHIKQVAS